MSPFHNFSICKRKVHPIEKGRVVQTQHKKCQKNLTSQTLWVHYISRYIYSSMVSWARVKKMWITFKRTTMDSKNSVCLENTMPTPKLVRFEIPNNKHHAQWTTKQYEKLEFLPLSRWKEKKEKRQNLQLRRSLPGLYVKLPETSSFDKIFNGKVLREDVSIHRTNLKYCGKSPKIRFLPYFRIL